MNPIEILLSLGSTLIERLFPDPAQAADAKLKLLMMQQSGELAAMTAQTDINKVEAANSSTFVSGWRPGLGWVCVLACGWNWIGMPVVKALVVVAGYHFAFEQANISEMLPILMGMLGLGGLRTIEKINNVAAK
jgi:hypothetical protein